MSLSTIEVSASAAFRAQRWVDAAALYSCLIDPSSAASISLAGVSMAVKTIVGSVTPSAVDSVDGLGKAAANRRAIALANRCATYLKQASVHYAERAFDLEEKSLELAYADAMSLFLSHPHWYKASVRLSEVFEACSSALALTALAFAVTAAEALPSNSEPALRSRLQARVGELTQLAKHALPEQTADIQRALRWVRRVPAVVATRADQMVLLLRHAAALERRQHRTEDAVQYLAQALEVQQSSISSAHVVEAGAHETLVEIYVDYSACLCEVKRYSEAVTVLERAWWLLESGDRYDPLLPTVATPLQHVYQQLLLECDADKSQAFVRARDLVSTRVTMCEKIENCQRRFPDLDFRYRRAESMARENDLESAFEISLKAIRDARASDDATAVFFVDRFSSLLGELAEHREDMVAALENFRSSVAARTQWYGALDTDTIAARLQVASLLRASKEHDAAIAEFESIIAIDSAAEALDASVKPTPPQLLYVARVALARQASIAHSSVAACLLDVGRVDEAEQRLRLACEYSRRVLGEHARETVDSWRFLGGLLDRRASGKEKSTDSAATEAAEVWERVVRLEATNEESIGGMDNGSRLAHDLEQAALAQHRLGDWTRAIHHLESLIAYLRAQQSFGATETVAARIRALGETLAAWRRSVAGPNDLQHCAECGKQEPSSRSFNLCGACRSVAYCSGECQRRAWTAHKSSCKKSAQ